MAIRVKNDRNTYRKREIAAPKGKVVRRDGALSLFFSAPLNGLYLDLRPSVKPKPVKKG